jgi:hypothetical protein
MTSGRQGPRYSAQGSAISQSRMKNRINDLKEIHHDQATYRPRYRRFALASLTLLTSNRLAEVKAANCRRQGRSPEGRSRK